MSPIRREPASRDDRQHGKHRGDLVADDLRRGTHPAHEGVLVVRGPAARQDADHREPADGQEVEKTDVEVGGDESPAEGQHDEQEKRRHQDEDRGGAEHGAVRGVGDDVFLDQELARVRQRLQQAKGSHAVGAAAQLHAGGDLPLEPDDEQRVQREEHGRGHGPAQLEQRVEDHRCPSARGPGMGSRRVPGPKDHIGPVEDIVQRHRSISGTTRSRLPITATRSAIFNPRRISASALKLEKLGLRIFTRQGFRVPSLTM